MAKFMICGLCGNDFSHKIRKLCVTAPCESSLIKKSSNEWKIRVLGKNPEMIAEANKKRLAKGAATKIKTGVMAGANNPQSKAKLKARGLSDHDIEQHLSNKAAKAVLCKKQTGFYDDPSNNPYAIEFWIQRGLSPEEAVRKIKSKNHNCQEYWEARGLDEDQAKEQASKSADTNSLQAKLRRHGESGEQRYVDTRTKMAASWNPNSAGSWNFGSSKSANLCFRRLYKKFRRMGYSRNDMVFKLNGGKEFWIRSGDQIFFYDFVLRPLRIVIEYNGEHVHVPPYLSEDERAVWKHAFSKKAADEVQMYDELKKATAEAKNFKVYTIWSKSEEADLINLFNELENYDDQNQGA